MTKRPITALMKPRNFPQFRPGIHLQGAPVCRPIRPANLQVSTNPQTMRLYPVAKWVRAPSSLTPTAATVPTVRDISP
jgi:hypothetical protein